MDDSGEACSVSAAVYNNNNNIISWSMVMTAEDKLRITTQYNLHMLTKLPLSALNAAGDVDKNDLRLLYAIIFRAILDFK